MRNTEKVRAARVAVHFQSILEKFTPNDTTFTFVTSTQLKDSALSSACSLHTASASIKSSCDSLRQRGLAEIAEDARENQSGTADGEGVKPLGVHSSDSIDTRAQSLTPKEYIDEQSRQRTRSIKQNPSPSRSTRTVRNTDKALPPTPLEPGLERNKFEPSTGENLLERGRSFDLRSSFQSTRPSTRDLQSAHGYKPKVKLGPRPSVDSTNRPLTADSTRNHGPRPISMLPASVRLPARIPLSMRSRSHNSRKSSRERSPPTLSLSPPLPILPIHTTDLMSRNKPNVVITPVQTMDTKSPSMTPEKRRLMKALQLRQKQMAARTPEKVPEIKSSAGVVQQQDEKVQIITSETCRHDGDEHGVSASNRHENDESEIVQMVLRDTSVSNALIMAESSPISVLEPSDGPSTQASSITDEEDVSAHKTLEPVIDPELLQMKAQVLPANDEVPRTSLMEATSHDLSPTSPQDQPSIHPALIFAAKIIDPHELPLPPVDDDEVLSLSHSISLSEEENTSTKTLKATQELSPLASSHAQQESCDEGTNSTRPSTGDTMEVPRQDGVARSDRRISSNDNSEDHFLSDDAFMEELGSATVQEAKPISVSKSPITPFFPKQSNEQIWNEATRTIRSVSSPAEDGSKDYCNQLSPELPPPSMLRSFSASQSVTVGSQQASAILPKKLGVSTGISQRIKALEKLSSRPTSPSQAHPNVTSAGAPPASVSLRKASLRMPQVSPDMAKDSGKNFAQKTSPLSPSSSLESVTLNGKNNLVNVKLTSRSKKPRPESISVTATIIRDPRNLLPTVPVNLSEPSAIDLYKSPLTVEHQSAEVTPHPSPLKPPRSKFSTRRSASSSSTERKSEHHHQMTRRGSFASRKSTPSRRGSEPDLPRSPSDTSSTGLTGLDGIKEEKKESRKSRLFKRMSHISSASRRSIVYAFNSPVKDQPIVEHHEAKYEVPPAFADFGDVNIQFPDTLVRSSPLLITVHLLISSLALEAT